MRITLRYHFTIDPFWSWSMSCCFSITTLGRWLEVKRKGLLDVVRDVVTSPNEASAENKDLTLVRSEFPETWLWTEEVMAGYYVRGRPAMAKVRYSQGPL